MKIINARVLGGIPGSRDSPGGTQAAPGGRYAEGRESNSELVDFIQGVALGKKKATADETDKAIDELRKYLPDLLDQ